MENQPDPAIASEANMPGDMPAPAVEAVPAAEAPAPEFSRPAIPSPWAMSQDVADLRAELENLRRQSRPDLN